MYILLCNKINTSMMTIGYNLTAIIMASQITLNKLGK